MSLPAGSAARRTWLAEHVHETDDARIVAALRTVRDIAADDVARNAACAVLWRALKPLIEATTIRLARLLGGSSLGAVQDPFDAVSDEVNDLILDTRAEATNEFIAYAARRLHHLFAHLVRSAKRSERVYASRSQADDYPDQQPAPTPSPDASAVESVLLSAIRATATRPHHVVILEHYFGIGPFRGEPLPQHTALAVQYGLTHQRVAQLVDRLRRYLMTSMGVDP